MGMMKQNLTKQVYFSFFNPLKKKKRTRKRKFVMRKGCNFAWCKEEVRSTTFYLTFSYVKGGAVLGLIVRRG